MIIPSETMVPGYKLRALGVIVLSIIVILTTISLFYTKKAAGPAVIPQAKSQPVVAAQPKPIPTPPKVVAPVIVPAITSDYTLPPIQNGMAPIVTNIPTDKKVVFLTIDDGAFKDPSVVSILAQNHIQAALFLAKVFIASDPSFFNQITVQGSVIEDHTLNHDQYVQRSDL